MSYALSVSKERRGGEGEWLPRLFSHWTFQKSLYTLPWVQFSLATWTWLSLHQCLLLYSCWPKRMSWDSGRCSEVSSWALLMHVKPYCGAILQLSGNMSVKSRQVLGPGKKVTQVITKRGGRPDEISWIGWQRVRRQTGELAVNNELLKIPMATPSSVTCENARCPTIRQWPLRGLVDTD